MGEHAAMMALVTEIERKAEALPPEDRKALRALLIKLAEVRDVIAALRAEVERLRGLLWKVTVGGYTIIGGRQHMTAVVPDGWDDERRRYTTPEKGGRDG